MISKAVDYINDIEQPINLTQPDFKLKTNLSPSIRIQQGARVMYLNNSLIEKGICNGTVGIITDIDRNTLSIKVAFCIHSGIVHHWISSQTSYFYTAGQKASRTQFPLQNSFALTVHKTQGLTLPNITLILDDKIFSAGQAYVVISCCSSWENLDQAQQNFPSYLIKIWFLAVWFTTARVLFNQIHYKQLQL